MIQNERECLKLPLSFETTSTWLKINKKNNGTKAVSYKNKKGIFNGWWLDLKIENRSFIYVRHVHRIALKLHEPNSIMLAYELHVSQKVRNCQATFFQII